MNSGAGAKPATRRLPDCYSLRRASPFLGLVAVVRSPGGRALSFDGRHWQLQVAAYPPRGLWSGDGYGDELRYFRFGVWTKADGVARVPLSPILHVGRMLEESERLVEAVAEASPRVPFALVPELELWLLDADDAPLALLATAIDLGAETDDSSLTEIGRPDWNAGGRGERRFVSATLSAQGIAERDGSGPGRHADLLERRVFDAAGGRRLTQWFRRDAAGGRCFGFDAPETLVGRWLPDAAFPDFNLRVDWSDETTQALVDDYFRWLSPYLLMLPALPDVMRRKLELAASQHASAVSQLWRMYPRVLDTEFVHRARVEAELRRAHA
ncbi:MAG: hypothetical protein WBG92_21610 [Thiohalocapsa sp.]